MRVQFVLRTGVSIPWRPVSFLTPDLLESINLEAPSGRLVEATVPLFRWTFILNYALKELPKQNRIFGKGLNSRDIPKLKWLPALSRFNRMRGGARTFYTQDVSFHNCLFLHLRAWRYIRRYIHFSFNTFY